MDQDLLYKVGLNLVPRIGNVKAKQLISYCGSAEAVFNLTKGKLERIPGIGPEAAKTILSSKTLNEAEDILEKTMAEEGQILFYTDEAYPDRLKAIDDAPCILYSKGQVNLNHDRVVAIVGTRQATAYGKEIVAEFIRDLVPFSVMVVSGLALGIDIEAHKRCLEFDIPTVGVMANGLETVYPPSHLNTAKKMLEQGGLLTENPIGTVPEPPKFPARNRIIAGMSDAIIVVEAGLKGGALITAEIANSYNKDVFAFPGSVHQPFSSGCNQLIKSHRANLITGAQDLDYIMGWSKSEKEAPRKPQIDLNALGLTSDELSILSLLQQQEMFIDELSRKTQIPINQLASTLLMLEFKSLVKPLPGKSFRALV